MSKGVYALYKGDKYLMDGTIYPIAKAQGCKESSVRFLGTPAYRRRTNENSLRLVKMEATDDG